MIAVEAFTKKPVKFVPRRLNEVPENCSTSVEKNLDLGSNCAVMESDWAVLNLERWEDMRHPTDIWNDPSYADTPLDKLRDAYMDYVTGRENPISKATVPKYRNTLASFFQSLEARGELMVLASVTPTAVRRWITDQRAKGLSEEGIASRLNALKAFTNKYVHKTLELTNRDLLGKVGRIQPPERPFPELTDEQQRRLLGCFDRGSYEDVRNRAIMAVFLATALRFSAVLTMKMADFDRVTGDVVVITKGNQSHLVRLSPNALREVRTYLKRRPGNKNTDRLWLKADGTSLGEWGMQSVFRRMKERAGIPGFHAHLLRHNFAKKALRNGASCGEVQDMLGHKTSAMTRRYLGDVAKEIAARNMVRFSPL